MASIPSHISSSQLQHLKVDHPEQLDELTLLTKRLEGHFKEVQKVTYIIEDGQLFVLQAQSAPRSPKATIRIAVEMVKEGMTSKSDEILKLNPKVCMESSNADYNFVYRNL